MLPKSIRLVPTALSGGYTKELQAQTPWGPQGMRGQGGRCSQIGCMNELVFCIISALEEEM